MKTILVDAVNTFIIKDQGIFEEMHKLLETYPNRKIILTNATEDKYPEYWLDRVPYEVFTLSHNPEKTDPNYYKKMLEHFALKNDEVVYFENNAESVESARSVGINTLHYDKVKRDLVGLKDFLDGNL